ncbi:unnamed protein product [Gadus morhua 'NCC']
MAVMSHDRWVARELDIHSVYVLGMRESVCGCASRNVAPHVRSRAWPELSPRSVSSALNLAPSSAACQVSRGLC